jgi:hypothetical protein
MLRDLDLDSRRSRESDFVALRSQGGNNEAQQRDPKVRKEVE